MGKYRRACLPWTGDIRAVDLGTTKQYINDTRFTFKVRRQAMLPAPICYLYIVLSNNVQMSWSTKYQTRQDVTVQYYTAQRR